MATTEARAPFLRVSCKDCGNKQIVFSRASTRVVCTTCGTLLAEPAGGRAKIHGDIIEQLQ